MSLRVSHIKEALVERGTHDLGALKGPVALAAEGAARLLGLVGQGPKSLELQMKIHSAALSGSVDKRIVARLRHEMLLHQSGRATSLDAVFARTIASAVESFRSSPKPDPRGLIGTRLFVMKKSRPNERGVVVADYNYIFPLLAGTFDLRAIAEKYFIVLEPGWNGYCTADILLFTDLPGPIFVETIEPRDRDFLTDFGEPFVPVFPLSTNSWADYRHVDPLPAAQRDIDVIMIAAWARYKRHWRFFKALSALRRRGQRLSVALVGYPADMTGADIMNLARDYGIDDQVTMYERIPGPEVAALLSRSKLHVLWSLREGSNRAIVEALLADVPSILRQGFNFGYHYPHINEKTGLFVAEKDLAEAISDSLARHHEFSPREWALANITCQHSTARLEQAVRAEAERIGETWTEGLSVKLSTLDTQEYWHPEERSRFAEDHAFLESTIRHRG